MDAPSTGARPVRSFVAIEIEEPARGAIVAYLAELRGRVDGVAWTRPENMHLTLKFLGGVAPERLTTLAERLAAIAGAERPFVVAYRGVGAFPSAGRPQVLWVGAAASELAPIAAAVDEAASVAGVARELRPFHPHVTLGRMRPGRRARGTDRSGTSPRAVLAVDAERAFGVAVASALVLFRSDTNATGARHTPLARLAFGYE